VTTCKTGQSPAGYYRHDYSRYEPIRPARKAKRTLQTVAKAGNYAVECCASANLRLECGAVEPVWKLLIAG
jgi:hypothetical protein